ncbi:MAG: hypothetical protein IT529_01065 [Burkholderiales bacterium]|nr:hypothetical protein [Burkholderiales bacterium]
MPPAFRRHAVLAALGAATALAPAWAPGQEGASQFAMLVKSRLVHCAFYREYEVDRRNGDHVLTEGRSNSLTHFQSIRDGRASQISTRMAGSREVRVIETARFLHFIDRIEGMYLLTTVYGCIDRDGGGVCLTFGAVQSRHFDARVVHDPDAVYEALKDLSDPGFCDHSFIGVQEASTRR